jgi:hypothetical protein
MVKPSTPFISDYVLSLVSVKENLLPGKYSMLVVMGYSSAFHVMPGILFPRYEMILN